MMRVAISLAIVLGSSSAQAAVLKVAEDFKGFGLETIQQRGTDAKSRGAIEGTADFTYPFAGIAVVTSQRLDNRLIVSKTMPLSDGQQSKNRQNDGVSQVAKFNFGTGQPNKTPTADALKESSQVSIVHFKGQLPPGRKRVPEPTTTAGLVGVVVLGAFSRYRQRRLR